MSSPAGVREIAAPPSFLATRKGKLTLAFLCMVGFLDFVDASIVNVALPTIRHELHFSVQSLQWVLSAYLLTYGGFMLLGGRAADLLGRRRVLVAGIIVFALSSLTGGVAQDPAMLVTARLVQGIGAAMMVPAALSILTTTFSDGTDRHKALGAWGGIAGLASAVGVFLGGVLTEEASWRWIFWVNLPVSALLLAATFRIVSGDRDTRRTRNFDSLGAVLVTGGMLLLVYALVKAPDQGWGSGRTIGELAGAAALLIAFILNESLHANPLAPLSIFRINGLGAANAAQVMAIGAFYAMFFFLTLYMQNVLGFSQLQAGSAYLPATAGVAMSSGLGFVFVGVNTAANAGVPPDKAGLAAALINTSTWVGGAFGLAIFSVIATSRTHHLLAAGGIFLIAAAAIALRATNTRGEPAADAAPEAVPATETA